MKKQRKNRRAKEKAVAAYQQKARPAHEAAQARIAYLEKKIQPKDDLLTELTADRATPGRDPEDL